VRHQSRAVRGAAHLRRALEQSAAALAGSSLDGLLAAEAALNDALAQLPPLSTISSADRPALREDLEAARRALRRCRRLGASLSDFITLSLAAQGRASGYDSQRAAAIDAGGTSWRA
jgi:hypothetical protein